MEMDPDKFKEFLEARGEEFEELMHEVLWVFAGVIDTVKFEESLEVMEEEMRELLEDKIREVVRDQLDVLRLKIYELMKENMQKMFRRDKEKMIYAYFIALN